MDELTTTRADHWATGPRLPRGEFWCTRLVDGVRIDHADPRILIAAEIVDQAAFGLLDPCATLEMTGQSVANGHVGALLKIRGTNRQVVYRLTEWMPDIRGYVGEWPE